MAAICVLLLGNTIWGHCGGIWKRETVDDGGDLRNDIVTRLGAYLGAVGNRRVVLVFEPVGIQHQMIDVPKVNRNAFASLARVRSDYPVIEAGDLGWGIEQPEAGLNGSYSTILHAEETAKLVRLRAECERVGCELSAAWPAYTVAAEVAKGSDSLSPARTVVIMTPAYTGIAVLGGGRRLFKGWVGSIGEREWKAISGLIGDFESHPSPGITETMARKGGIVVVADGDPEQICPLWKGLRGSGRLGSVVDMEAFARSAMRIPLKHPANLIAAFPRPLELNRTLAAGTVGAVATAVAIGALTIADIIRQEGEMNIARRQAEGLELRIKELRANGAQMDRIRSETPDGLGPLPVAKSGALASLSEAVPDGLTITSLLVDRDGDFEIEANIVETNLDQEKVRHSLSLHGFVPALGKGWIWDQIQGRLRVSGRYRAPRL